MKKVISSLLVAAMAFCATVAKADNIGLQEAKAAAAYYMATYTGYGNLTAKDVVLVHQIDNEELGVPAAYFFNIGLNGWVIMGGSTVVDPIIGYSDEGSLDMDRIPDNMMWFINGMVDMVIDVQKNDAVQHFSDVQEWLDLKNGTCTASAKVRFDFMTEKWGQGDIYTPTYNYFCPQNNQGLYSVTGCVATALAQLCHYYKFPKHPTGTAKYWLGDRTTDASMGNPQLKINYDTMAPLDYVLMPDVPTNTSGMQTCTDAEMHEVARLNYALGVAVKMGYSPESSGAVSSIVPEKMQKHFKYTLGTLVSRNGTDTAFINRIYNEIADGQVLYMNGASPDGGTHARHAFVCCGHNSSNNKFKFNWGWDGSGNGWFDLAANTYQSMKISGMGYSFYMEQGAIFNMYPTTEPEEGINGVESTVLGNPYPNPATQTVTLPFNTNRVSDLLIYSIDGKLVNSCRVNAGNGEVVVEVSGLPAGIYIYRLNDQSGKFMVR